MNNWQKLPKPFLVLAPMEDVTDLAFRQIVATHLPRPEVFFTEFTSADGLSSIGFEKVAHRLKYTENQRPIIAQIWGTNPDSMYKAAAIVKEYGFDGVDINMGCPDRNVMKQGAGAAMCKNKLLAGQIIDAVKAGALGIPVSVKTRLGYNSVITDEWIGFLLEQNLDALTIHGRIARQMSRGDADWGEIGKCVQLKSKISPNTIIIGNGDINSYQLAISMHQKYAVDGIMIGRGIFHNPWVFEKTPDKHTKDEYLDLLARHVELFDATWGQDKSFHIMKKFFKMYVNGFPGASKIRAMLMQQNSPGEVFDYLKKLAN